MTVQIGVAEAKRRFSELLDRIAQGESFMIERWGRPAAALLPPDAPSDRPAGRPKGALSLVGLLSEIDVDDMVSEIYAARERATDRPAPELD